jgi:hypothetical protein
MLVQVILRIERDDAGLAVSDQRGHGAFSYRVMLAL